MKMNDSSLTILSALAEIQDIQDFRLRDFTSKLGLDAKQPSIFYRELLKESREAIRLIKDLQSRLYSSDEVKRQIETKLTLKQRQNIDLEGKLSRVQNETQSEIIALESKNQQLETTASELLEMAGNYKAMKDLLKGRFGVSELCALADLFSGMYQGALFASIGGNRKLKAEDLERMTAIRKRLREEFMAVLQIPKDELEERLTIAEKANEALKDCINIMYRGKA